jgi:transposase
MTERPTRRQYSPDYKMAILAEYDTLDRAGKGAMLRRERLYTSLLSEWRRQRDQGAIEALTTRPGRPAFGRAERDNARLRSRAQGLQHELDRARQVIESQTRLAAMLHELETADGGGPLAAQ